MVSCLLSLHRTVRVLRYSTDSGAGLGLLSIVSQVSSKTPLSLYMQELKSVLPLFPCRGIAILVAGFFSTVLPPLGAPFVGARRVFTMCSGKHPTSQS